jgi:arylsulfatase A-like enzyme
MEPGASGVVGFSTVATIARPESTLPELLKRANYQTVHVGRGWHQQPGHCHYGFEIMDGNPFNEHYSRFHTLSFPGHMEGRVNWPHETTHGLSFNDCDGRPWPYDEEFHEVNYSVNKGLEFLRRRDKSRPFFLSVGFTAPHPPLVPPQCFYDQYIDADLDSPAIGSWAERPANDGLGIDPGAGKQVLEGARLKRTKAAYYGAIAHIDNQLRLLLGKLGAQPEPTYIFFVSDHGEMLGDHYFWRKSLPYEGSSRIPFLLSGPGIEPGAVLQEPVGLQDILPTCCEMAGLEVPAHATGRSLMALARGEGDAGFREWFHGEHAPFGDQHPGMHYLTDGEWKYIWFNDGSEQLFDLKRDPHEMQNLSDISEHDDRLKLWRARLIEKLAGRPEGFSDGERLIAERPYPHHNSMAQTL